MDKEKEVKYLIDYLNSKIEKLGDDEIHNEFVKMFKESSSYITYSYFVGIENYTRKQLIFECLKMWELYNNLSKIVLRHKILTYEELSELERKKIHPKDVS